MLKRRIQDLTVCFAYNFSCLQPQNKGQKDFRSQYNLQEEIQRGGFGVVYNAYRVVDGLPVAVKYVEHKHVREWTMYQNQLIPTEVCHLMLCSQISGVVNLIDWFASKKGFMIVMERPEKCMDLFDVITAYGKLDEEVTRWIFVQIVDAILEMKNQHSLVHRDIKDENVIINMETGEVKLVDFGAADFIDSAKKRQFQGTRSYAPPEFWKQKAYFPLEATSWSLGILLYTMVVGRVPFRNEIQTCLGCLHFSNDISTECQSLIKKCLCVTPKRRLQLHEIRSHQWTTNNPSLKYAGAFSSLLRRRSLKQGNWRRRRRQNSVAWSLSEAESEDEPALRRSFLLATPSPNPQVSRPSTPQINGTLTPANLNTSIYDFLSPTQQFNDQESEKRLSISIIPSTIQAKLETKLETPENSYLEEYSKDTSVQRQSFSRRSSKRNPLIRQIAVVTPQIPQQSEPESFDMFQSVCSSTFSRYDSAREKTFDTCDSISLGQASSSAMYFSACESLPDDDGDELLQIENSKKRRSNANFFYDDSLRSLLIDDKLDGLNGLCIDVNGEEQRTRTPSAETDTEICLSPSPQPSIHINIDPVETTKKETPSLNKRFTNGVVRRARSLKLHFSDKSTLATKKHSTANDEGNIRQSLPLKVVQHLAANSYDTLLTLSAKMVDKQSGQVENVDQQKQPENQARTKSNNIKNFTSNNFSNSTHQKVDSIARMAKISNNLGDIVAERRQRLLQNVNSDVNSDVKKSKVRSKSKDSGSKSLQYETVRFPLAIYDVCAQQLPFLERVSK